MWLFGRQYSNFLRFYSNLLDVVFLLYDPTYLLQWQVMQYPIDFHHPHHVSVRAAVLRSFFTTKQSTTTIFVSCFHPVVPMCPFLTPALSLPCTQLCSQPPAPTPQPPTSLCPPQTMPTSRATRLGTPGLKWKSCEVTAPQFMSLSQPFPRHTHRL